MPFLASGKLVSDYTPIRIYQEIAREKGKDPSSVVISSQDLGFLRDLVTNSSSRDVQAIISILASSIKTRIDPEVARETYRRYLGADIGEESAVSMISELVAKWCIEAADTMGIIRIKGYLRS
ncbi:MAG: hypothetical protein QXE01_03235 [Sulfolobales archaeon]